MRHFTNKFLKGLLAALPVLLSVFILVWFVEFAERITRRAILFLLPTEMYVPGLGIVIAIVLIYLLGALMDRPTFRYLFRVLEEPFKILPMVRSVYQAIKDFTVYLAPSGERRTSRVVAVKWPGTNMDIVGLVTSDQLDHLPAPLNQSDRVSVYIPMSYQFGGFTLFVPRSELREVQMGTEAAMRSVLTAWVSGGTQRGHHN